MEPKFYYCETCKNIITKIEDKNMPVVCCGHNMKLMEPCTSDGASEKHVPVIEQDGNKVTVKVGEAKHPMTKEHLISWIVLSTDKGFQIKYLSHEDKPHAVFYVADGEKPVSAVAYCNIHELWKAKA